MHLRCWFPCSCLGTFLWKLLLPARYFHNLLEGNMQKKGGMAQKVGELTQMWVIVNSGWTGGGSSRVTFLDWF